MANATAYSLELDECVNKAIATLQTTGDRVLTQHEYDVCAQAVDKKYGRE